MRILLNTADHSFYLLINKQDEGIIISKKKIQRRLDNGNAVAYAEKYKLMQNKNDPMYKIIKCLRNRVA